MQNTDVTTHTKHTHMYWVLLIVDRNCYRSKFRVDSVPRMFNHNIPVNLTSRDLIPYGQEDEEYPNTRIPAAELAPHVREEDTDDDC